jgi:hypothetical protein
MKRILLFPLLVLFSSLGLWTSCKEDIDFSGDYAVAPVIIGLLDASDSLQYIKVMRTFGGSNNSVEVAQIEDSNYFAQADVVVEEWRKNGTTQQLELARSWTLQEVTLTNKVPGAFFAPNQKVYRFDATAPTLVTPAYSSIANSLLSNLATYKMKATLNGGEIVVNGSTELVSGVAITSPSNLGSLSFISNVNGQKVYSSATVKANNGDAKVMDCRLKIYINEYFNGTPVEKAIEWKIDEYTGTEVSGASSSFSLSGFNFYTVIKNGVTNDPTINKRELNKIVITVTGGTNELSQYILVNEPTSSLAQSKPLFTNLIRTDGKKVIGIFSSRGTIEAIKLKYMTPNTTIRALDEKSEEELCIGPITGGLFFCSDNPIYQNPTPRSWVCQ